MEFIFIVKMDKNRASLAMVRALDTVSETIIHLSL